MIARAAHIVQYSIRIFLMVFWLYVALDKLWDLEAFHRALLRQPFPNWWADVLYWSLPLIELGIARYIMSIKNTSFRGAQRRRNLCFLSPYLLSTALLLIFTLYIALGVAGLYAQRPCGCASVFSELSWDGHLLVNMLLVALSILGWYLTGPTTPMDTCKDDILSHHGYPITLIRLHTARHILSPSFKRLFPRRFAPFPGRPVHHKNLIRAAVVRRMVTATY